MRLFMLFTLLLWHSLAWAEPIIIKEGWVREAPPTATVSAAYMQIENTGKEPVDLLMGRSDDFGIVEIHDTVMENGVARMVGQSKLTIPAEQTVTLQPGGLHIMLINRQSELKAGDEVHLILYFSGDVAKTLALPVKTMTDSATTIH